MGKSGGEGKARAEEDSASLGEIARANPELALDLAGHWRAGGAGAGGGDLGRARRLEDLAFEEIRSDGARFGKRARAALVARLEEGKAPAANLEEMLRKDSAHWLGDLGEAGLDELERAYPGFLGKAPMAALAESPEALGRLIASGRVGEREIGELLMLRASKAEARSFGEWERRRGACELACEADPKGAKAAWRRVIRKSRDIGWGYGRPLGGLGAVGGLGAAGAKALAQAAVDVAREEKMRGFPRLLEDLEELGRRKANAEEFGEGEGKLFRELGMAFARGAEKFGWDWRSQETDFWRDSEIGGTTLFADKEGVAEGLGALPLMWMAEGKGHPDLARWARGYWEGWREGGGGAPKGSARLRKPLPWEEIGAEEMALSFLQKGFGEAGIETARFLLSESGWSSLEGIERAKEFAREMDRGRGRWNPIDGLEQELEAAAIALGSERGLGAGKGPRGL